MPDFLAENYKQWGCTIEFVTNRSQEGSQFCRGFGGIGGMLRWKMDFTALEDAERLDELTAKGGAGGAAAEDDDDEYDYEYEEDLYGF